MIVDFKQWLEKMKTRQKSRTKTWDRENNPSAPAASLASRPSETTPTGNPSTVVDPTLELNSQTPVGESAKTLGIASDNPPSGVTEPYSDVKTLATQADPKLAPKGEIKAVEGTEKEGTGKLKLTDDAASARDDALFLLWDGAYDALPKDDVPVLSRYTSRYRRQQRRLQARWNTSDGDGFDPMNPVARQNIMRQILEALLAESDPNGDKGGGNSNSETELTSFSNFSKFMNIIRQVALRESQRGAAVAWIAIWTSATALIRKPAPVSLVSWQYLVEIMSAMEWYCSLPALLLEQPSARIQETRMAILDLYKAILLYIWIVWHLEVPKRAPESRSHQKRTPSSQTPSPRRSEQSWLASIGLASGRNLTSLLNL